MPTTSTNFVLTFSEKSKGWVSFKSFTQMQLGISMANDYYTFHNGEAFKHYSENQTRNTFYEENLGIFSAYTNSSLSVVLNDNPSVIKGFNTLNYEGSQSKVDKFINQPLTLAFQPATLYNDQAIYNLAPRDGWFVENVFTDKEVGNIDEFIEKEGKWFNNINRTIDTQLFAADTADFTFQGIGIVLDVEIVSPPPPPPVPGCMDQSANNYNSLATVNDGSCTYDVLGCTDPTANNYDQFANVNDGSCTYDILGCTDPLALNYDSLASVDDGSCQYPIPGCTDPTACNYNTSANVDDGSCNYDCYGCTDPDAFNYDPTAIYDDGNCEYKGCTDPSAINYDPQATIDDGSCTYILDEGKEGCMDPNALNYDPQATIDDGSCVYEEGGEPRPNGEGGSGENGVKAKALKAETAAVAARKASEKLLASSKAAPAKVVKKTKY
jgi:hypothetical protein